MMPQDRFLAPELISALCCCALSLSLALSTIVSSCDRLQGQSATVTDVARSLSPGLVLLSGLVGVTAACSSVVTQGSNDSSTAQRRRLAFQVTQHSAAIIAVLLTILGFANSAQIKTANKLQPSRSSANDSVNEFSTSDPVTIRPPEACAFSSSNGTAYVCVGLAVILALICQTALCWLSNRDGRSVTNVEIVVEKGQLEQHQQQLDSLKPIAGGRIGAANRKRRPPTSSSAAAAAAKTPSSSAVSSSRAQDIQQDVIEEGVEETTAGQGLLD
ncbi:hypothetical protein BOX15_Mlig033532g1 [Macrostomum lignano]|uniref:Transmembrane protein n=2 Tax=Macrostomum lignano TaxID=282301 RepID=A0A1I8GSL3_9PLAT|nr:hypothetical protein BOX15_Mlig033532g1 [Macrostomum lignano]